MPPRRAFDMPPWRAFDVPPWRVFDEVFEVSCPLEMSCPFP